MSKKEKHNYPFRDAANNYWNLGSTTSYMSYPAKAKSVAICIEHENILTVIEALKRGHLLNCNVELSVMFRDEKRGGVLKITENITKKRDDKE